VALPADTFSLGMWKSRGGQAQRRHGPGPENLRAEKLTVKAPKCGWSKGTLV
jgi:hypothetical protein